MTSTPGGRRRSLVAGAVTAQRYRRGPNIRDAGGTRFATVVERRSETSAGGVVATETYEFLSPGWIDAVRHVRERHAAVMLPFALVMNLSVTDSPFDESRLIAHVEADEGGVDIDLGHLEGPDVAVTLDYETAKSVFVDRDGEAAMAAFMAGKVRVEGDMTKLLAFQSRQLSGDEAALATEIRELTA
jgi:putative sterol carrier protein